MEVLLVINPCDEILDGEARYSITKPDGSAITSLEDLANCKISLITEVMQAGTPVNKNMLLSLLDFAPKTTVIENDTITESDGIVTKTTTFNNDGSITEVLTGGGNNKRYTKVSEWNNGQLVENVTEENINEQGVIV